jgi:hypothetical protein
MSAHFYTMQILHSRTAKEQENLLDQKQGSHCGIAPVMVPTDYPWSLLLYA